jgi:hypothetical protein
MLRAMARLNGDDQKTKSLGNRYSSKNRARQAVQAKEAAAMGLSPLDPLEQHELQRKLNAGYKSMSERAVAVPRVGRHMAPPRPALIDIIPRRKGEEEIRFEFDNFETPAAPAGVPTRSSDERKDELAIRNQFNGKTPQEILAEAPPKPSAASASAPKQTLREQIEDEVAERHQFLDQMKSLGKCDQRMEANIKSEVAERMQDLKRLDALGSYAGGGDGGSVG